MCTNSKIVTNIEKVTQIIEEYKELFNISSLNAVLSVDAVSFIPTVLIDEQGFTTGLVNETKLSKEELGKINESFSEFEALVKSQFSNETITNCFVFNVQPINLINPCFVVHMIPSIS